ncbi:hypothetical protein DNTS_028419 [Danionella cerebrum]|uniref:Uncharacterized protein n=1 Tax=Danionella cerebrum TaxID=2873325 RepID=A0A553NW46_9TELE|nr:hypothetical protein DNTS_028419 [Danionella translucida]
MCCSGEVLEVSGRRRQTGFMRTNFCTVWRSSSEHKHLLLQSLSGPYNAAIPEQSSQANWIFQGWITSQIFLTHFLQAGVVLSCQQNEYEHNGRCCRKCDPGEQ